MGLAVKRLVDDPLRGGDGQVGELAPKLLDRLVAFEGDLFAGAGDDLVGVLTRARLEFLAEPGGRLLGAADGLLAFRAGLIEDAARLSLALGRSRGSLGGAVDAFLDLALALVQYAIERLVEEEPEDDQIERVFWRGEA